MGTVYYAIDPASGRPFALKVLHQGLADDPAYRARFHRETITLCQVTGPYLVPLIDADPDAPLPEADCRPPRHRRPQNTRRDVPRLRTL
ncbi:hypothetical protein ACGFZR_09345 [Streptomyces sp. NPDC048241]|uniref:hypothetical protein n=1 Tax=Streptomyces sp. NPDC048241 TaxID=3365521 RepID=UPI0037184091